MPMKIFSTRFHGALDYGTVIALPSLFRWLRAGGETRRVADGGAAFVLAYSLLTRYEWGAAKVLPMPAHLALDALLGAGLVAAAAAAGRPGGETAAVRGSLLGLGLFSLFASVVTETGPGRD
jgi:hypothetical protein